MFRSVSCDITQLIIMKTTRKVATLVATIITFGSLVGGANGAVTITLEEQLDGTWSRTTTGSIPFALISGIPQFTSLGLSFFQGSSAARNALGNNQGANSSNTNQHLVDFGGGLVLPLSTALRINFKDGEILYVSSAATTFTTTNDWSFSESTTGVSEFTLFRGNAPVDGDFSYRFTRSGITETVSVSVIASAVPEPSSTLLLCLGALGIVTRHRRN